MSTSSPGPAAPRHHVTLVTGPSGAGRSTAINALEDLGFEAIDNLPLTLVPRLLDGPALGRPLALGVDARNRDFSAAAFAGLVSRLSEDAGVELTVLYLDCLPARLVSRFSETRRRHPLAPAETPATGIAREIDLLGPVRVRADVLIDTSELSPGDLRGEVARWFDREGAARLALSVHSFSYRRGLPHGIDMAFDCRFLRNPYWLPELRGRTGTDPAVGAHIEADPRFEPFFARVRDLADLLLPAYAEEGKSHFSIGFGCTGGQHRSVHLAERLGRALAEDAWAVSIRHRELEHAAARGASEAGSG